MSSSTKWTKALGIGTGFIALVTGGIFAVPLLAKDAFAGYRNAKGPLGDVGMRLDGVKMQTFDKGKLVESADIDRVDVRPDRQYFEFFGVRNGFIASSLGKVDFSSDSATYDRIAKALRFQAGVKLKGDEFDLFAPKLTLDEGAENLQAPGPVTGTLKGGIVQMMDLKYTMKTEEFRGGRVSWTGQLPQDVQKEAPSSSKTAWKIDGDGFKTNKKTNTWKSGRATDGEIIVKAPEIIQDRSTDVLTCSGPVYYFSKKANLVADKAVIYRKEKRAVLTGNVRMLVKPKDSIDLTEQEVAPFRPDVPTEVAAGRPPAPPSNEESQQQKDLEETVRSSKTARKYPAMVKAAAVEYWYGEGNRHGIFTGAPEAYQEFEQGAWRRVFAFKALYDGEKESMRLESEPNKSDVRVKNSIGDDLRADWFVVSTKEDDDDSEGGHVTGWFMGDDSEVPKKKTPPPTEGSGEKSGG